MKQNYHFPGLLLLFPYWSCPDFLKSPLCLLFVSISVIRFRSVNIPFSIHPVIFGQRPPPQGGGTLAEN